jgi:hypothetical protein
MGCYNSTVCRESVVRLLHNDQWIRDRPCLHITVLVIVDALITLMILFLMGVSYLVCVGLGVGPVALIFPDYWREPHIVFGLGAIIGGLSVCVLALGYCVVRNWIVYCRNYICNDPLYLIPEEELRLHRVSYRSFNDDVYT